MSILPAIIGGTDGIRTRYLSMLHRLHTLLCFSPTTYHYNVNVDKYKAIAYAVISMGKAIDNRQKIFTKRDFMALLKKACSAKPKPSPKQSKT